MTRKPVPCKIDSVLGLFSMVANTTPWNEGILQLLHGGSIIYSPTASIILSPFSSLADLYRVSTNIAIFVRAACQPCTGASDTGQDAEDPQAQSHNSCQDGLLLPVLCPGYDTLRTNVLYELVQSNIGTKRFSTPSQ